MITVESRNQVKVAKRRIRTQMRNWRVLVKDVAERSEFHGQTVKDALNPALPYWNEDIARTAQDLISEKKSKTKSIQ